MTDGTIPLFDAVSIPIVATKVPTEKRRATWKRHNDRKDQMLGMKHGTAAAQLRKMILFDLVCRLDLGRCFRCEKKIESVDELSIEHMESWQKADDPRSAFFNLANISFSHLSCNTAASNLGRSAPHGIGKYMMGCRCDVCVKDKRSANAKYMADWRAAGKDKSRINFKGQ